MCSIDRETSDLIIGDMNSFAEIPFSVAETFELILDNDQDFQDYLDERDAEALTYQMENE